jgi:hypothetical protein
MPQSAEKKVTPKPANKAEIKSRRYSLESDTANPAETTKETILRQALQRVREMAGTAQNSCWLSDRRSAPEPETARDSAVNGLASDEPLARRAA